jgi:hypothetical protein
MAILRWLVRDQFDVRLGCCVGQLMRIGPMEDEDVIWIWQCPVCGMYWEGDEHSPDGRTIIEEAA